MSVRVLTDRMPSAGPSARLWSGRATVCTGLLALAAASLFAGLADQVTDREGITRSDPWLLHDIISVRSGTLTAVAKAVTNLGTAVAYLPLAGAGYWYWRKRRSFFLPVAGLLWMGGGLLLRLAISRAVARSRPSQAVRLVSANGFAFPSGHTATAAIGFGLMALLLGQIARGRRLVIGIMAVLVALAVGASRSYLGVHWPTDVLGGWIFGIAWVALGAFIVSLAARARRFPTANRSFDSSVDEGAPH